MTLNDIVILAEATRRVENQYVADIKIRLETSVVPGSNVIGCTFNAHATDA
jgi:hypothetical protein